MLSRGHLSYDPLIWSKVTSLSSTASVLRECKISLEFQDFFQKDFFFKTSKYGNSCLHIIYLKTLSGSENFSGLNDLNQHDNITGLNNLNSLFGSKNEKNSMHFTY